MKNIFTLIAVLICTTATLFGQSEVILNLNHKVGDESFVEGIEARNNLGNTFSITRLQYYISEISLTHDNGTVTNIADTWVLADIKKDLAISLGTLDLTSVEKITFGIGVEEEYNHKDPSTYPAGHPLAPQNPTMHWGWTSGYRFVCMEGWSGTNLGLIYQLHGLGDGNYFKTTVDVEPRVEGGKIYVELDANYSKCAENINLMTGPTSHGEVGDAKTCLQNFNNLVFSQAVFTSNVEDISIAKFNVWPNPSTNKSVTITLPSTASGNHTIYIADANGRQVHTEVMEGNSHSVQMEASGVYFITLVNASVTYPTQRLIVQ